MSKVSLRDKIRQSVDGRSEVVTVPEWDDVKIEVRSMTGKERARYLRESTVTSDDGTVTTDYEKLYPSMLVACCYDPESGEKLFEPADREWLNDKNARAIERVATVASRLSGIGAQEGEGGADGSSSTIPSSTRNCGSCSTSQHVCT